MSEDHEIELFILKNAVITKELRSAFASNRLGNIRGALEAQADSLVEEYLRQVDFQTLADAERMSEFYKLFYALENDIRDLIEATMVDSRVRIGGRARSHSSFETMHKKTMTGKPLRVSHLAPIGCWTIQPLASLVKS